ncbi:MAG: DUF374 domain-containing protein [Puniceicoccales bacterium]|jgi:lysophospholipid acyltransferase (LPLAT)-like uncharacterized protein|nr:DUF374 domain-containing protein [Puniceicoccales bacterium]
MTKFYKVQTLKKWWQRVVVVIVVGILKIYWATLRVRLSNNGKQILCTLREKTIFTFWHNNLFAVYALKKLLGNKNVCGLVSPSSDGAWLTEIFQLLGIDTVRGSSRRNGILAISNMIEKLSSEVLIAITPDGPRGPKCKFKIGTAMVAKGAEADVVIVAAKYDHFFTLPTWDRFKVPLPFSRILVEGKTICHEDFRNLPAAELSELLEKQLNELQTLTDGLH